MPGNITRAALACGIVFLPHVVFAAVVINEIFFDPAGSDTGLEKIELYNPDAATVDMGGWELYPDGIGYFTFPEGFSLPAQSFVAIHLRTSGTDDAANRYHATPSSNMGNSSGSVALFRPGGRGAETIVDFVRYHKPDISPPPAERKTWESSAVEAGLWSAGAVVNVSSLTEGSSIGLAADGVRGGAGAWQIFAASTLGGANAGLPGAPPPPPPVASTTPSPSVGVGDAGRSPPPSLRADAGSDAAAIAGAIVLFRGQAFGLDDEPLTSARFLWNFGDGLMKEGKALNHVYYFPGTYRAELAVSSGEFTGSDWRTIIVRAPELSVSEAMPGEDGFVELYNASAEAVDLGGMRLTDQARTVFPIPPGTLIEAGSVLVLANRITGLHPSASLALHDASTRLLDSAVFSGALGPGGSFERRGSAFVAAPGSTPGTFSIKVSAAVPAAAPRQSSAKLSAPPPVQPEETILPSDAAAAAGALPLPAPADLVPPANARAGRLGGAGPAPRIFLAASMILGLIVAAALVVLKRSMSGGGST